MWQQHGARINAYVSERAGWEGAGDLAEVMAYVQRAAGLSPE